MLTLAGSRVPAPDHSSLGCRNPAVGSPGCTPRFTACSCPWEKAAIMPCPLDSAAGKPCSGAHPPPLHYRNCESPPERPHRLWDVPAFGDPSRNTWYIALHPETYHVGGFEDLSSSEVSAIFPLMTAFNLSLPHSFPLGVCRQCPQPCCALQSCRSWAELSLCSSAHLS